VSPTGSRPPSRNRNNDMPGDEELGFEAAVAALGKLILAPPPPSSGLESNCRRRASHASPRCASAGMKTTVSEAEHPLLCEGTRRVKGDLALALMITYKDDQSKLKKVTACRLDRSAPFVDENMVELLTVRRVSSSLSLSLSLPLQILDKLLDRESQTHKPQTLSSFYSSKPAAGSQRSPSKHAAAGASKHAPSSSSSSAVAPSSSSSAVAVAGDEAAHQADPNPAQSNSTAGEGAAEAKEHGETLLLLLLLHLGVFSSCRAYCRQRLLGRSGSLGSRSLVVALQP